MLQISKEMLAALLRNKGMLTIGELARITGVNRFTLSEILSGEKSIVQKNTYSKLVRWLTSLC